MNKHFKHSKRPARTLNGFLQKYNWFLNRLDTIDDNEITILYINYCNLEGQPVDTLKVEWKFFKDNHHLITGIAVPLTTTNAYQTALQGEEEGTTFYTPHQSPEDQE